MKKMNDYVINGQNSAAQTSVKGVYWGVNWQGQKFWPPENALI